MTLKVDEVSYSSSVLENKLKSKFCTCFNIVKTREDYRVFFVALFEATNEQNAKAKLTNRYLPPADVRLPTLK